MPLLAYDKSRNSRIQLTNWYYLLEWSKNYISQHTKYYTVIKHNSCHLHITISCPIVLPIRTPIIKHILKLKIWDLKHRTFYYNTVANKKLWGLWQAHSGYGKHYETNIVSRIGFSLLVTFQVVFDFYWCVCTPTKLKVL